MPEIIKNNPSKGLRELPKDVEETLHAWLGYKRRWWFLHYFFGISALVGSVTVASRPLRDVKKNKPKTRREFLTSLGFDIVAWYTAVCIAIVTFLMPSRRARAYVAAARILSDARNRYINDSDYPLKSLLDAVKMGEDIIARADPV